MGERLFSIDPLNRHECQARYRGDGQQEYYRGDFWIEDADRVDVVAERRTVGPVAIIRQRSATNLFFRRTRKHIREDATDLSVLWFPKFGRISFSTRTGDHEVAPNEFAITRSTEPFFVKCRVDGDAVHEVLHVTIPTQLLRGHVPPEAPGAPVVLGSRAELSIAANLFTDVFEDDGGLADGSAQLIVDTALRLIGDAVRAEGPVGARESITQHRQREIRRFIEINLSNPQLSGKMVANGCGVSSRYLSFLFSQMGTTFARLVWRQRLDRARQFLRSEDMLDQTIAEIAFDLGFKSAAHFSRLYKRTFGINPRDYRAECHGERPRVSGAHVELRGLH